MKRKVMKKMGNVLAVVALGIATIGANTTCWHYLYDEKIPESVKRLSK